MNERLPAFRPQQEHILGQSGLIGSGLPNHKTLWQAVPGNYELKDGADAVRVMLEAPLEGGGKAIKTYTFPPRQLSDRCRLPTVQPRSDTLAEQALTSR